MSLDRGFAPQTALVNYGGRLQDTGLGLVSLLCDARFKTFSQGIDIVEGTDVRSRVRAAVPGFRTHLERFAADAGSKGLSGQQTRLWFYPDTVELTLSAEGDLLAMRRARMAAASEKVQVGTAEGTAPAAPWTKATVDGINRDYDALARLFPEMADLDHAVRWLSLFTWLRAADRAGLAVPELDALLAIELPATPTPRHFPQLLAFNAVPESPGPGAVDVFERVDVGAALDRLAPPSGRPLPAAERFRRALAALDRRDPQQAALAAELAELNAAAATDTELDAAAFRAERLRMHQLVLGTLPEADRAKLRARAQAGDPPRVFSVGIGGLDLGMGASLARAAGRGGGLTGLGATARASSGSGAGSPAPAGAAAPPSAQPAAPREAWQQDPAGLPAATLPAHAPAAGEMVAWPAAADVRYRRATRDASSGALSVVRVEAGRALRYRVEPGGAIALLPFEAAAPAAVPEATAVAAALPDELMLLQRVGETTTGAGVPAVVLRLSASGGRQLEAPFPRAVLQRLVLGREADLTPEKPLPGFSQLPPALASLTRTMVVLRPEETQPPWASGAPSYPGEESTLELARALSRVVGRDGPHRGRGRGRGRLAAALAGRATAARRRGAAAPGGRVPAALRRAGGRAARGMEERARGRIGRTRAGARRGGAADRNSSSWSAPKGPLRWRRARWRWRGSRRMKGKLLAILSLGAPLRVDLAARLLADGNLAGVGLAAWGGVGLPRAVQSIGALDAALAAPVAPGGSPKRVEDLPGPFAWTF